MKKQNPILRFLDSIGDKIATRIIEGFYNIGVMEQNLGILIFLFVFYLLLTGAFRR